MISILFICHGNICRSAAAEMILAELVRRRGLGGAFEIASAATSAEEIGNDVYPPMKKVLQGHGVPCRPHSARRLTAGDGEKYDLLIGMDDENMFMMRRMLPEGCHKKLHLLSAYAGKPGQIIDDPWYTRDFETAYREILEGCEGLLDALTVPEKRHIIN